MFRSSNGSSCLPMCPFSSGKASGEKCPMTGLSIDVANASVEELGRENVNLKQQLLMAQLKLAGPLMAKIKSANDFKVFLTSAMGNKRGPEYKELYNHLQQCFTNADQDLDGMINAAEFDSLVEVTAMLPRAFGFAPSSQDMYMCADEQKAARVAFFKTVDVKNEGEISFQQFLSWAMKHIQAKVTKGITPWKAGTGMLSLIQPKSADDFVQFLQAATSSKESPEYKELYFHLLRCFTDADVNKNGLIDAAGFDGLIDIAAMAPRKFGFAPPASQQFKNDAERKASRASMFRKIDKDGSGTISFSEFLDWAFAHIKEKVKTKVSASYKPSEADIRSMEEMAQKAISNVDLPLYESPSAEAFAKFCTVAVTNTNSPEYQKLYYHLLRCFSDADTSLSGKIGAEEFDALVDVAASAPRKFGFAPLAADMFVSVEERKRARAELFKTINTEKTGSISFQEFLDWATHHIKSKVKRGAAPYKEGVGRLSLIQTSSSEDFVEFLKAATSSKSSPEFKDLYYHLLRCFTDADVTKTGVIDAAGFDGLIDIAAMAPRKYGFAPSNSQMFKNDAERKESRAALFQKIDRDGGGTISFDEFLNWAFVHIKEKVSGGVAAKYPPAEIKEDMSLKDKNLPMYGDSTSAADFAKFCTAAVTNKNSSEYQKLYYHLLRCFSDADTTLSGKIGAEEFDILVDVAAAAPRKFGFAPQASEMFVSVEEKKSARADLFKTINTEGTGSISFQEFLEWATHHIKSKVKRGATPWKEGVGRLSLIQTSSSDDFVEFLQAATSSKKSPEYKDLYYHLLRCFTDADVTKTGVIDAAGFDGLIDIAAMAPRKYGFAPSSSQMFKNDAERKESRAALFQKMNLDGTGTISFNDFLDWAFEHIKEKVSGGVAAKYPPAQIKEDMSLKDKNLPMYGDSTSAADFAKFCMIAVSDKKSSEYQKMYYHLLRCFSDGDKTLSGQITAEEFDDLIDTTAAAPRKFGFAPEASDMFATVAERKKYRANLFRTIDADGSGQISFQEFLEWAMNHIGEKVGIGLRSFKR